MGNSCCSGTAPKDIEVPQNLIPKSNIDKKNDQNEKLSHRNGEKNEETYFNSNVEGIIEKKAESPDTNIRSNSCKGSSNNIKSKLCLDRVARSKQRLRKISDKEVTGFKSNFFKQK